MKPKEFIGKLDEARLVGAIARAERESSGEIRIWISEKKRADALQAAKARFSKLGMEKTKRRNAVLIYFAPACRQFALWGDIAVHEKCGESFWKSIAEGMTPFLKRGEYTEAVEFAVKELGQVLAKYSPREPGDINELPDSVIRD